MIGATIQIEGTTQGTVTDIDGRFVLTAPSDGVLIVSYVGMQTERWLLARVTDTDGVRHAG